MKVFQKEKKKLWIRVTTPRLNFQQNMSHNENNVFKMGTSKSITLNIYKHFRWHEITFSELRMFEEYSQILSISDMVMWNTQRGIIFTTRVDIPRVLSNEIIPSPIGTSSLFYQWNIISYRRVFIIIIILPMDRHYPING